ncbi:16045_t:CDS:1 [Funneliformis mosseae]|uniref:16045_t:CDS:1 n=1 Tax=Funneliformis mosseae TaxID=27381 RepID=A0A9N9DLV5_FUNMO|nr:16045_t:CDS:1 [Funneliformis mosseae]
MSSSIQKLSLECFDMILNFANPDWYSCIRVNKSWRDRILPKLWSQPFNDTLMPTTPNGVKLMNTYISCLSEKQKEYLNIEGTEMTSPRINYPGYLKELDYEVLEQFTRRWILEKYHFEQDSSIHLDIFIDSLGPLETECCNKRSQKLLSCLYSMFIEKSTNLTCFSFFSSEELCLDLPMLSMKTFLWNLRSFICIIDGYDLHLKNLMEFMEILSKQCQSLEYLDISWINRHGIKICNLLSAIIEKQSSLKEIRLHTDNYVGINRIIEVLISSQRDCLLTIQFEKVNFGCPNNINGLLDSLKKINKLKELSLIHCITRGMPVVIISVGRIYNNDIKGKENNGDEH